ncbi:MAG: hypothetical protein J0M00_27260, partial [Burkholderiales bacterium]|nr:hypothetical protein [Burkholderiales bacterium]
AAGGRHGLVGGLGAGADGVVQGRIEVPGQRVLYTLDLAQPRRLVFDALAEVEFTWSLLGPSGLLVNARSFQSSDSRDRGGFDGFSGDAARSDRVVYNLPAGTYTLTVDAPGNATGDFAFRLLDLDEGLPLTVGAEVQGMLASGNATQAYRLNVAAGDRLVFDSLGPSSNDLQWRLVSPTGEQLWSSWFGSDAALRSYLQAGTYTLLIEGRRSTAGPAAYRFQVQAAGNLLDARVAGFEQQFDGPALDPFWQPGNANLPPYRFETLDGASVLRWQGALGPQFQILGLDSSANADLSGGFTYEVRFNTLLQSAATSFDEFLGILISDVDNRSRYASVVALADANGAGRQLRSGTSSISGGAGYENRPFAFADNTWYRLKLSAAPGGVLRAAVLADDGSELVARDLGIGAEAFPKGALFSIYKYKSLGGTVPSDVAIDWARLSTTPPAVQPLVLGQDQSGNRSNALQRDLYSFTLTQPTQLMGDSRDNFSNLNWTLLDERGVVASGGWFDWPAIPLPAGSYTLRIDGARLGAYAFRLVDLGAAEALGAGTPVSGTLNPGTAVRAYAFDGQAGQRFYFDAQQLSGSADWALISPSGRTVWTQWLGTDMETELAESGRYTLALNGYNSQTTPVDYRFVLHAPADTQRGIALNTVVDDRIEQPGQRRSYRFSVTADTWAMLDTLSSANFNWTLSGPRGVLIGTDPNTRRSGLYGGARTLRAADAQGASADPAFELRTGDYLLTIDADNDATGSFAFALRSFDAAVPLALGSAVSGALNPANETRLYHFDASAGDRFFLDVQQSTNNGSLRLYGPLGQAIWATGSIADVDVFSVPATGRYTLWVEGLYNATGANDFRLLMQPLPDAPPVRIGALEVQPGPDLRPQALQVEPDAAALEAGGSLTVRWQVRNDGTLPADQPWRDRVVVTRVDTGEVLVSEVLAYDTAAAGAL